MAFAVSPRDPQATAAPLAGHLLAGQRGDTLLGTLAPDVLVQAWPRLTSRIVKYGFALQIRDLEPPRTGIFDGLQITLDPDLTFEMHCFVLLHLFGHSVQWVAPSLADRLQPLQTETDPQRFLAVLQAYEYQAAQFGRQLLAECGLDALGPWFSDFVETDWRYVERFYREGRLPAWEACVTPARGPVVALPIPPLVHRRVEVRYAF